MAVELLAMHDRQDTIIALAKLSWTGGAANGMEQVEHEDNVLTCWGDMIFYPWKARGTVVQLVTLLYLSDILVHESKKRYLGA